MDNNHQSNEYPIWEKKGLIFKREDGPFFKTHTTRPIPLIINENLMRIFFGSRCDKDTYYPTFIDVNPNNPSEILYVNEKPILDLGKPGSFDDSGICPVSILKSEGKMYLYYAGMKRRRLVSYETSIGVAELLENGTVLKRVFEGPIISQDRNHPILVAAPFVIKESDTYKMWYCSASKWINAENGPEPIYSVNSALSKNGFDWNSFSGPLLKELHDSEVITAPWIVKYNYEWLMWYSYRGSKTPKEKNYKIGLAVSKDSSNWIRKDNLCGIERSKSGWDSEMICYPSFYNFKNKTIMIYCGNHVGRGGIGWAVCSSNFEIY